MKTEHEAAGVLRFLDRQILEHRWQGVQKFEHGVLKPCATSFLSLFHEAGNRALALAELRHREAAKLVKTHHFWHRREDDCGFQSIAVRTDSINNFLCKIFNEDQGSNKDIRFSDVFLKICIVELITKFLDEITAQFDANRTVLGIKADGCLR